MISKTLIWLCFLGFGVALALLLGGCASTGSRLEGSGVPAPAPYGYSIYCADKPDAAECGGTK